METNESKYYREYEQNNCRMNLYKCPEGKDVKIEMLTDEGKDSSFCTLTLSKEEMKNLMLFLQ